MGKVVDDKPAYTNIGFQNHWQKPSIKSMNQTKNFLRGDEWKN
jgi:hypothetical protein